MDVSEPSTGLPAAEPESLSQLRGDCARMAPHWQAAPPSPARTRTSAEPRRPRGVHVPARSAHLLDGMSDYGD